MSGRLNILRRCIQCNHDVRKCRKFTNYDVRSILFCRVKAGTDVVNVVLLGLACTEEEWGKSLALCGPGAESPGEVERGGEEAKALSYQERFVQLQVFLKKCDEDDQSYLLDGEEEDAF